ncbi:MAG: PAS domain S-box protein [Chloroflexi bacterium]|nr:PAS domain S-box protein [Chloroflexota bacterium]
MIVNTSQNPFEALLTAVQAFQQQMDGLPPEHRQSLRPLVEEIILRCEDVQRTAAAEAPTDDVLEAEMEARARAESALFDAQEQLQAILENIKDYAIFTMALDGRITTWNAGAQRIFGFSEAEILGQNAAILFTPDDQVSGEAWKEQQQALTNGYAEDERWHLRRDGSRFFASGTLRPLRDRNGDLQGFIKVARDVTRRHQTETAERERRILAEALRDIATVLTSTLNLDQVLEHILMTVGRLVPHDSAYILLIDNGIITRVRSYGQGEQGLAELEANIKQYRLRIDDRPLFAQIVDTRRPLIVPNLDTVDSSPRLPLVTTMRSYLGTPILIENDVIGLLNVMSSQADYFNDNHAEILQLFAYEAAIAIRNAQLYLQAQELAALQERQQLARDLHDAVTQTLFSASVLTETLTRQWQRQPDRIPQALTELHQLIKAAMAEMRTLLLQLRPPAILNTSLDRLLHQLVTAMYGRRRITVALNVDGEFVLPPDAHIALYRIAQEALNNITKHSKARHVTVNLRGEANAVELTIQDDGRGFDATTPSGGLGLQMMRERAEAIGAQLEITSGSGQGTAVRVVWKGTSAITD